MPEAKPPLFETSGVHIHLHIPPEFTRVIEDIAVREDRDIRTVIMDLAIKGAECSRLHREESNGRR